MVAGAVVIVLALVIGGRAVLVRALCEQNPIRLHVSAAQDIAPAVLRIGQYFNDLNRDVGGHCAQVEVTEDPASTVAAALSGTSVIQGEGQIDAWVPDSSLWPEVVRISPRGAAAVRFTGVSVARSPLVIAVPQNAAGALAKWSRHINWQALFPESLGGPPVSLGLQIQLPDPSQNAAGLATIVEIRRLLGAPQQARDQFTAFVHNVEPTTSFQDPQGLAAFTAFSLPPWNGHPVTVTSEQAVGNYNRTHPRIPLMAFYPAQEYDLDYPFVVTTSSPLKSQVAQQFEEILKSSFAATYILKDGFRSPSGNSQAGNQYGIVGNLQPAVALAAPGEAGTALQAWQRLNLGSRDLVLNDVSSQDLTPFGPNGENRLQVMAQAANLGLSLFPDSTQMAAWEYSYRLNGSLPYRVLVPMGPLPEQLGLITRRQQLQQYTRTITAQPGAPAALYGSLLAALQWMTAHYQPGHINAVIVLGNGTETAPHDISFSELITKMRQIYDPRRPVEMIIVSAGGDENEAQLQQVAAITHGQAYTVDRASDIISVFYDAIARRICSTC